MNEMLATIVPKSDQMNADDLIGRTVTIEVTGVKFTGTEQPVDIHFDGDNGKPYRPCKSMRRVLVFAWGPDAKQYVGRKMQLYRDPDAMFGGQKVGGIRISHMSHIEGPLTMALTATKGNRKPYVVKPLAAVDTDRIASGVATLLARIGGADEAGLKEITADPAVVKQREFLAKKHADLAKQVDDAIAKALEAFASPAAPTPPADDFPGVVTPRE